MHVSRVLPVSAAVALGLAALGDATAAQVFQNDTSRIPSGSSAVTGSFNASNSENVDFGDVDLDGDWDAMFADGGDAGNDQNRLWINAGGAQGGVLGYFRDATDTRLPRIDDDSRDVEFADIDNDGDLDAYISNTSQIVNQTNRWWVNDGGNQGGTVGFYTDETAARWVGLGGAGSSIPPTSVIGSGGFVDWSCDCDFGDLDNDGDLDLVHTSYGAGFGGLVPTRLFLNDGDGFFSEFNQPRPGYPNGFQLTSATMDPGDPALWCEGDFTPNTLAVDGSAADICTNTLDADVGDVDGDFDLDILHGDRDDDPRFFFNLQSTLGAPSTGDGSLSFRDGSNHAFPGADWATTGNYEQEMADFDLDGDLDLYGLNWGNGTSFDDIVANNPGNGDFGAFVSLAASGADDNEGDFLDYDNDGDLDLFVANFSGTDKLYRNDLSGGSGTYSFVFQGSGGAPSGGTALDADACDIDGDGDYDVMVGEDSFQANRLYLNINNTPDTHAPYIPNVEGVTGEDVTTLTTDVVRAQVYDNAPYYITWYNPTHLEVTVDGFDLPPIPMRSSAGQIFRGEIPGNLVGDVTYRVVSADEYGNTGFSAVTPYTNTTSLATWSSVYGSGLPSPNNAVPGIQSLSVAFGGGTMHVGLDNMAAGDVWYLGMSLSTLPGVDVTDLALVNIGSTLLTLSGLANASGEAVIPLPLPDFVPAGLPLYFQAFTLDLGVLGGAPGYLFSSSQGLAVVTQ
jgi:hypothetical protein